MKKAIKNPILTFILGLIIASGITVLASTILARDISYKNTNVEDALDDLYAKAPKKICELKSGTANTVSAKYECDPGDGVKRNFFVFAVDNNKVKLIMEHNITEGTSTTTMTWMDAMKYFDTGDGASTKASWTNVIDVDLPMAQDIANAVGNTEWNMEDKNSDEWFFIDKNGSSYGQTRVATSSNLSEYRWLYNYTKECNGCDSATSLGSTEAYGYWTRDIVAQATDSTSRAWCMGNGGSLYNDVLSSEKRGVRPVITVLKTQLLN